MFSRSFSVDEALEKLASLDCVFFTENFSEGLSRLSTRLKLDLKVHRGKSQYLPVEVTEAQSERLREMLEPEYKLLQKVRECLEINIPA